MYSSMVISAFGSVESMILRMISISPCPFGDAENRLHPDGELGKLYSHRVESHDTGVAFSDKEASVRQVHRSTSSPPQLTLQLFTAPSPA